MIEIGSERGIVSAGVLDNGGNAAGTKITRQCVSIILVSNFISIFRI